MTIFLALLLAVSPAWAAKKKSSSPKAKPAIKAKAPAVKAAAPAAPAAPQTDDLDLAGLGAALAEHGGGLLVLAAAPGSRAEGLGLKSGDRVLFLGGASVRTRAEAAAAVRAWTPLTRLSAIVRRGGEVLRLMSPAPAPQTAFSRGPADLSPAEKSLMSGRLKAASAAAAAELAKAPHLEVRLPEKQAFWLRLPKGLPVDAKVGDILEGETTTASAASPDLDYLALPPFSKVWLKVASAEAVGAVRRLRLIAFKLEPSGGQAYPISAKLMDMIGDEPLLRMSPGGTLVAGDPILPDPKRKLLAGATARFKAELLEAVVLREPPSFFQAGPGLWVKTKETASGRVFDISQITALRAASRAGLKPGQTLASIAGKSTEKLDYPEAIAALYGKPGSKVKVEVLLQIGAKPVSIELVRGVVYADDGAASPTPSPYQR